MKPSSVKKHGLPPDMKDPGIWFGPRWLGLYRNASDPRLFVPKPRPWLGKTINFGHPGAKWPFVALIAAMIIGIAIQVGESLAS